MCALIGVVDSKSSDLALHVCRHQVVLIPHDVQGGDGRLLVEATGLPAVVSAASLPQVNAEDFPGSASVEQHGDLEVQRDGRLARVSFLTLVVLVEKINCRTYPNSKLLSQYVAAGAVRLRAASLCILHYHSTGEA